MQEIVVLATASPCDRLSVRTSTSPCMQNVTSITWPHRGLNFRARSKMAASVKGFSWFVFANIIAFCRKFKMIFHWKTSSKGWAKISEKQFHAILERPLENNRGIELSDLDKHLAFESLFWAHVFFFNFTNYFVAAFFTSKIAQDRQINFQTSYFRLKLGFKKVLNCLFRIYFFAHRSLKRNWLHKTHSPLFSVAMDKSQESTHIIKKKILKKNHGFFFFLAKCGGNIGELDFKNFFSTFCIRTIFFAIFCTYGYYSEKSLVFMLNFSFFCWKAIL